MGEKVKSGRPLKVVKKKLCLRILSSSKYLRNILHFIPCKDVALVYGLQMDENHLKLKMISLRD